LVNCGILHSIIKLKTVIMKKGFLLLIALLAWGNWLMAQTKPTIKLFSNNQIKITYPQNLDATTATKANIRIWCEETGMSNGTYSTVANEVTYTPNIPFRAGEKIIVTSGATVKSTNGTAMQKYVWQLYSPVTNKTDAVFDTVYSGVKVPIYTNGYSISVADFNKDGNMDIITRIHASYGANTEIKIYLQNADGTFKQSYSYTRTESHSSITDINDLNNDGFPDVVITHNVPPTVDVYLNKGDGTLLAPAIYTQSPWSHGARAADIDGDGDLDLVAITGIAYGGQNYVCVFKNKGNGTFESEVRSALHPSGGYIINNADVDNDGDLDFITGTNNWNDPILKTIIYANDGNGNYSMRTTIQKSSPTGCFDFNNDGNYDLLYQNTDKSKYEIHLNDGNGAFSYKSQIDTNNIYLGVAGDITGDGFIDLIRTATLNTDGTTWSGKNYASYINDKTGNFTKAGNIPCFEKKGNSKFVDFDGDGDLDIIFIADNGRLYIAKNRADKAVATQNVTIVANKIVEFTINTTTSLTNENIIAYQGTLTYAPVNLQYIDCSLIGTLANNGGSVQVNSNLLGTLVFGYTTPTPLVGSGALLKIRFRVLNAGTITPEIIKFMFNNKPVTAISNGSIISTILYGDVDGDEKILAYDGALALQASVGFNPLPEIDPYPWEPWRIKAADVDNQPNITANDASEIVKKSIGLITKFPVETNNKTKLTDDADVNVVVEGREIVFYSKGDLFGFNAFAVENATLLGNPVISNELMSAININANIYAVGVCTAYSMVNGTAFMRIPVNQWQKSNITFDLIINTNHKTVTVDLATNIANIQNSQMLLYPNPANDLLTIKTVEPGAMLSIYSINGHLHINRELNSTDCQIDISNLPQGIYSVQIQDKHRRTINKLVIQ